MNRHLDKTKFSNNSTLLWLSIFLFFLYIGWIAARPQSVFWTVDEGGKFIYIQNTIRSGNPASPLDYPARALDPNGEFYPSSYVNHRGNQVTMWWQAGFPLLAGIFYQIIGWLGLYIIPAICGVATAYLAAITFGLMIPNQPSLKILVLLVTGLATPIAFYSTMFWEHTLTTCGAMAATYFLLRGQYTNDQRWYYFAGISAALAVFFRVEVILLLAGFGVVLLIKNWRNGLRFGFSTLVVLAPLIFVHAQITGSAFTPVLASVTAGKSFQVSEAYGSKFLAYFLYNPPAVWTLSIPDVLVVVGTLGFLIFVIGTIFKPMHWIGIIGATLTLITPVWILVNPSGYRSLQGLITAGPCILFSIWLFIRRENWQSSQLPGMLAAGLVLTMLGYLYKSWVGAGGLQWGPRYLLSFYPILVVAGLVGLHSIWDQFSKTRKNIIIVLYLFAIFIGLGFQVRGALTVRTIQEYYQQSESAFREFSDRPVVTAWCDIVYLLPNLYWEQQFVSTTRSGLNRWAEHAKETGIDQFYVAKLDLCSADFLDVVAQNRKTNPTGLTILSYKTADYPNHE